jgi:hypothetical protein
VNQAIQFIDRVEYESAQEVIIFYAQVSGMLVQCVINIKALKLTAKNEALTHFEKYRFDYEEQAEQLIEDESYNSAGEIEVRVFN